MKLRLYAIPAVPAVLLILLLNIRLHTPGDSATVFAQLEFLGHSLHQGGGEQMQRSFPEGYVFTWSLYGLASTQLARQLTPDDTRRAGLLERARTAIEHVTLPLARKPFPPNLDPPYGAFYNAWSLYLRAEYIRAAGAGAVPPEMLTQLESDCATFAAALERADTPFLESYSGSAWPADASVGIAALGIRDRLLQPKYGLVIAHWVENARRRFDTSLGALPHAVDPLTGTPIAGSRGSSLALTSRVLTEAAPEFAREQYAILRSHFVDYVWGAPGVREYPIGIDGRGDVDSGPLLFGYSGPAIVVGAAAARAHGDEALADILLESIEVAGLPIEWSGSRRYLFGGFPVGDAFIAWARSSEPGFASTEWEPAIPVWWRLPWHALSLGAIVLLVWPLRRLRSHYH